MKITYIVEHYTKGLGYIDNLLPKELAKLGHEVNVIATELPMYYQLKESHFGDLLNKKDTTSSLEVDGGVPVHYLGYRMLGTRVIFKGLYRKLVELSPDKIIVRAASSPVLGQLVLLKTLLNYEIFTSSGMSYSSMPEALKRPGINFYKCKSFFTRYLTGRIFSFFVEKSIGSCSDTVDALVEFHGIPRSKTMVISLGVDTTVFKPPVTPELLQKREELRQKLGFTSKDIVCIWTGRMTERKGINYLIEAISCLNDKGHSYKGLFIGDGPLAKDIIHAKHVKKINFLPWNELPQYYQSADIGVWPKSITTSTLDASACGLPIIMSDNEPATERWEGAGSNYREGDIKDLMRALLKFKDEDNRCRLRVPAHEKMQKNFSWELIAGLFVSALRNDKEGD